MDGVGEEITQEYIDALGIPEDILAVVEERWGKEWWKTPE